MYLFSLLIAVARSRKRTIKICLLCFTGLLLFNAGLASPFFDCFCELLSFYQLLSVSGIADLDSFDNDPLFKVISPVNTAILDSRRIDSL
jgi:hypothetical protein